MTEKPDIVKRLRRATWVMPVLCNEAADEIERLRAERERINVVVTRRIHGYKSDDPIWYTVDHIAAVLEKVD